MFDGPRAACPPAKSFPQILSSAAPSRAVVTNTEKQDRPPVGLGLGACWERVG